jgi:uncharacterized membrane protein YccC
MGTVPNKFFKGLLYGLPISLVIWFFIISTILLVKDLL